MSNRIYSKVKPRGNGRWSADFRRNNLAFRDWLETHPGFAALIAVVLCVAVMWMGGLR
jgi:hypothetical protein